MDWHAVMRAGRVFALGFTGLVLLYLIVPTFVIVPLSFSDKSYLSFPPEGWSTQWYETLAGRRDYVVAVVNSLQIAIPTAIFATILGTLAALALVRGRVQGSQFWASLMIAPLMLPPIILGIALYPITVRLGFPGTHVGAVVGHSLMTMPLVFITVAASLRGYPPQLELAAMTLGANWWRTFWHVTFPMIRIGVVSGAILAFLFSFDELVVAMFLTGPATRTLPRMLWEDLQLYITPVVAAATTLILCFSFVLLGVIALVQRRGR